MAGVGHNSALNQSTRNQLKSIIERVEVLEEQKAEIADDIKDVYKEAKANGFDTKALRAAVKWRKQDKAKREEAEAMLELYLHALGDLADTPLGRAAAETKFAGSQVDIEEKIAEQRNRTA